MISLLNRVNWWRVTSAGSVAGVVVLLAYVKVQGDALERSRLVYENPAKLMVVTRVKTVGAIARKEGPVMIFERSTSRPDGTIETVREEARGEIFEVRGPVTETEGMVFHQYPVLPPSPRVNRWLAGVGIEPFHVEGPGAFSFHGGYSWWNRLDLTVGVDHRRRAEVGVTLRF